MAMNAQLMELLGRAYSTLGLVFLNPLAKCEALRTPPLTPPPASVYIHFTPRQNARV